MQLPAPQKSVVRFELAPRTVALLLATAAGVWLLRQLWIVGLLLVVSLVFAGTLNPLVEWMQRRGLKRTLSLVLLFLACVVTASLALFLTVPSLLQQLASIVHGAPAARTQLIAALGERAATAPLAKIVETTDLDLMFAAIQSFLFGYSSQALLVVGYFATTFVLSFYLLADGKRTRGALYAVVPRDYHMRLARILDNLENIVGGYMRGQLITSAAIAAFTFVLLAACRVPNALSLSLFAGLADVIPFVGGFLVAAPAVLSALPRGLPVAAVVLVALFLYMEFENRVLVPRVYGHMLRLSPTAVMLALLAGGTLLGVMGALLALPIAAGLQMILQELRVEMPGDDSDDRPERARNAKTEATYERMSAGSTAPEAGQIARDLAHEQRTTEAAREAAKGNGP